MEPRSIMADSSCVTNESNCVPSKSLTNKTNESTTIKSQHLFFDGLTYRWKGDLTELKRFFEIDLKLHGTWSSPGGEAKVFKSHDDLNVKWHGRKSQKIVIAKDNNEQLVVYHLHAKSIWFQTVQMERKHVD